MNDNYGMQTLVAALVSALVGSLTTLWMSGYFTR